jgi:hypothetical protein
MLSLGRPLDPPTVGGHKMSEKWLEIPKRKNNNPKLVRNAIAKGGTPITWQCGS